MPVTAAYPYINVHVDLSALRQVAQRPSGVVAIVGDAQSHGSIAANTPTLISSLEHATSALTSPGASPGDPPQTGPLARSVMTALRQDPAPQRLFAVATDSGNVAAALATLEAVDVNFVVLAETFALEGADNMAPSALESLRQHVDDVSAGGMARMGVAMTDPGLTPDAGAGETDIGAALNRRYASIRSPGGRMVLVAAGVPVSGGIPDTDLAAATAGAIAGYPVQTSMLLKPVNLSPIPLENQYGPAAITQISEADVNPLIDPELIPGPQLHLGAGRTFSSRSELMYIDIVRVLDDITFRVRAGLIGAIGSVRIDRLGMQRLRAMLDRILAPLRRARVITAYEVDIPLLPILAREEAARSAEEVNQVADARLQRSVDVFLSVTYGPAVHRLAISLGVKL